MENITFPPIKNKHFFSGVESTLPIYIDAIGCRKNTTVKPYYCQRPNGRKDWQILIINDGYIYCNFDNEIKEIGPNSVIIYKPLQPQFYCYIPKNSPTVNYIHFSGTFIEQLMKTYGLLNKNYYNIKNSKVKNISNQFYYLNGLFAIYSNDHISYTWGTFINLLITISNAIDNNNSKNINDFNVKNFPKELSCVIEKINMDYNMNYPVKHYADLIGYSETTFHYMFKKYIGISPIKYINDIKISSAKDMLIHTNESIVNISEILGFKSSSFFIYTFKNITGCSPNQYRKKFQNLII